MSITLGKITEEEQLIAKSSVDSLRKSSKRLSKAKISFTKIKVQNHDEYLQIPKKAFLLLSDIITNMADGKSVTLVYSDTDISTQEAAEMLNVSRPFVVKLLEEGKIPFKKAGTHRRIKVEDLTMYKEKMKGNAIKNLEYLSKQAQDLNLGY